MTVTPSDSYETPAENAFPPTDFREFIDSVLEANATGNIFIERMSSIRPLCPVPSTPPQKQFAQHGIAVLEGLVAERRDLDAHYGWVLASDAALVYRSMGGKSENGAAWARQWVRGVFEEYKRVGQALINAKLEMEELVRSANSG